MLDGSTFPLAENLRFSARLLGEFAPLGVMHQLESGVGGGDEDGTAGPQANHGELYTTTPAGRPEAGVSPSPVETPARQRSKLLRRASRFDRCSDSSNSIANGRRGESLQAASFG